MAGMASMASHTGDLTYTSLIAQHAGSVAGDAPTALAFVDLDHFKSVNDAFGHDTGDAVLRELSARIRQSLREDDTVIRCDGDEFLVILPGLSTEVAETVAERILQSVSSAPFGGSASLVLTASAGVAVAPDDGATFQDLMERAEIRLYAAKARGRNVVISCDVTPSSGMLLDEMATRAGCHAAANALHRFLDALPEKRRGVFEVSGRIGSGRDSFLTKAGEAARLRGFNVMRLTGRLETQHESYATIREAMGSNASCLDDPKTSLRRFVAALGTGSTVLVVDELQRVDTDSQAALSWLLESDLGPVGIVYSSDRAACGAVRSPGTSLWVTVELLPLSLPELRVMLRSLLQWEPPEDFVAWLYDHTQGLPGFVQKGLRWLLDRGVIERSKGEWTFHRDVSGIPLSQRIGLPRRAPPGDQPAASSEGVRSSGLNSIFHEIPPSLPDTATADDRPGNEGSRPGE